MGSIPVGIVGILLQNKLRELFAKPLAAAIFLVVNGPILLAGKALRRGQGDTPPSPNWTSYLREALYRWAARRSSRSLRVSHAAGVTMVAGLTSGLDHEESANFAFLLVTPVILMAGLYKLPELFGSLGQGVRLQTLVGALFALVTAYIAVRFLTKWIQTKTLTLRDLLPHCRVYLRRALRLVAENASTIDRTAQSQIVGELEVPSDG